MRDLEPAKDFELRNKSNVSGVYTTSFDDIDLTLESHYGEFYFSVDVDLMQYPAEAIEVERLTIRSIRLLSKAKGIISLSDSWMKNNEPSLYDKFVFIATRIAIEKGNRLRLEHWDFEDFEK